MRWIIKGIMDFVVVLYYLPLSFNMQVDVYFAYFLVTFNRFFSIWLSNQF